MNALFKLIITAGTKVISKYIIDKKQNRYISGSASSCQIVIKHPVVSRKHFEIIVTNEGKIFISDLGSTNGTFTGIQRLYPGVKKEIKIGNTVYLGAGGQVQVQFAPVQSVNHKYRERPFQSPFTDKEVICIGRNQTCDIRLSSPLVSRRHAYLKKNNDGTFLLTDNNSSNGTYVNGILLTGSKIVSKQDKIKIGDYVFTLEEYFTKKSIQAKPKKIDITLLLKTKNEIIIGRSRSADIKINDFKVSKKHAKIVRRNNKFFVVDLNSTNGTYVNNRRIKPLTYVPVKDTDEIRISLKVFKINGETTDLSEFSSIKAYKISKVYEDGYEAVKSVSFSIPKNSFIALMGPSGCGKSTLMNMLNGTNPPTNGTVSIFGLDLIQNIDYLKQIIGYVPQDDIVHKNLTVNKALYYAAKLRMIKDATDEEIENRITEVCDILKITKDQRKNLVANLSGGQRKRVSIAVELLNKPSIIFLDEPTSPLDPETIDGFLKSIRELAHKEGTTVVMVTHKPSDLKYVDRVIFMGVKGYTAYYGNEENMMKYFGVNHIIEIYSKLSNENTAKQWYTKFIQNIPDENLETIASNREKQKISLIHQYYWLTVRYANLKINDKQNILILLLQPLLIPLSLVFIYGKLELGIIFLMAITSIWFGVSNAAKEIVEEIPIYLRERMFNLKIMPYLLSKLTILSIIAFIQIAIYVAIMAMKYNSPEVGEITNIPQIFLFMFYLTFSATILGLFLSVKFKTSEQVMSIIPIILIPQIIFAGVISEIDSKPKEVLSYFMYGRWGTEGLARIQSNKAKFKTFPFKETDTIVYKYDDKQKKIELIPVSDYKGENYIEVDEDIKIDNKPVYKSIYQKVPKIKTYKNTYLLINDKNKKEDENYIPSVIEGKMRSLKPITYVKGKTYEKASPLKTLGYYENKKLYNIFDNLKKNIFAITVINFIIFILTLFFLKKKDKI